MCTTIFFYVIIILCNLSLQEALRKDLGSLAQVIYILTRQLEWPTSIISTIIFYQYKEDILLHQLPHLMHVVLIS